MPTTTHDDNTLFLLATVMISKVIDFCPNRASLIETVKRNLMLKADISAQRAELLAWKAWAEAEAKNMPGYSINKEESTSDLLIINAPDGKKRVITLRELVQLHDNAIAITAPPQTIHFKVTLH